MNSNNQPIGIFDSGVGGLSVWRELIKVLPNESVVYFADNANCPYGPKTKDEIIQLTVTVVDFLISKGCKMVVVACNTATAAAIDYLRAHYDIPFVGMEPAVKPAALNSKTKSIAVLATEGTFNGKLYLETSEKFAKNVDVNIKVGDKLVEIVENGMMNHQETEKYLKELIKPLLEKDIDHMVLGCTHYPFLIENLSKVLPEKVKIIDPAPAVVQQTRRVLKRNNLTKTNQGSQQYLFYTSGDTTGLKNILNTITSLKYPIIKV